MKLHPSCSRIAIVAILFLSACSSATGVNPTGLTGGQIMCPAGPRAALDCRGVLQQYARDFKADLSLMAKRDIQLGLGLTTSKLTEADALTSDLLQHSYQTCTLYNACIIPPQEYAAKSEKLQELQLQVRRALAGIYGQQQNIQINPIPGSPFPPPLPPGRFPPPGGPLPPGVPPVGVPKTAESFPPGGPGFPQPGTQQTQQYPGQPPTGPGFPQPGTQQAQQYPGQPSTGQSQTAALSPNVPGTPDSQTGDAILNILREGSRAFRGISTTPTQPSRAPEQDLDTTLRGMLQSLKQDVATRNPALASGRAVVGNFTEEGRSYGGPLGALLQDRVSAIVLNEGIFNQSTGVQTRGISVKEVATVANANDPKALTTLYNTDLAIAGTYQTQNGGVRVKLSALQNAGEIAQTNKTIPRGAIPEVVAPSAQNAGDTNQLISSLNQIGPQADTKINITTNRPGQGSSFRLGEEIKYFVTSNSDGYLYLFHTDADKSVARIFPNQYQREARIRAGQVLEIPGGSAPFKFEASPPFGLETTFAIVTSSPLSEKDLQSIQSSFAGPKQEAPTFLKSRGISVSPATPSAPAAGAPVLWNSVTVLIRP